VRKASWIDVLTGIGIILSLIFVASEIRTNTKAVRGATMQGVTDQSLNLSLALISVPELRAAYVRAQTGEVSGLTVQEEDMLNAWYGAVLRVAENRFRQRALGTFGNVSAVGGIAPSYRVPFFKAYWAKRRSTYPEDFAVYVDSTLIPLVMDSVPRIISR